MDNLDNCISFCCSYNLLPKSVKCPTCGDEPTKLYEICCKTTKMVDYQCNKKSCKSGRNQVQLRKGLWFEGANILYRKSILLVPVDSRDRATLLRIIEYVAPKTHIVSDCWKGYDSLQQSSKNYTHSTVNHSQNFVGKYNSLTLALTLSLTLTLKVPLKITGTLTVNDVGFLSDISSIKLITNLHPSKWRMFYYSSCGVLFVVIVSMKK